MRSNKLVALLGLASALFAAQPLHAAPAQVPIFLMSGAESLVMINMSNDHELFFKAYDDYSDVDGDGNADTTYDNTIDYYGYFDSYKCYSYSSGEFVPQAITATKYCDGVSGDWSGNFLNWATMSRIDAIRKVLYGGYRSTDSASKTVLERTFLPTDAHSFVKYYANTDSDIQKLTPYSGTDISICNTTPANSGNSKDVTAAPQMRVAQGDFSMWTAHEVRQCSWSQENNNSNNNQPAITGINASTTPPSRYATGSAEYTVRVEVCKSAALAEINCQAYPDGNLKPIGLLQEHGEDGSVKFGLMTGSYEKNKSGGVLRKNVSDFRDEVNESTNGTFTGVAGIVDTLNKFRLTRYSYNDRQYNNLDSCGFGKFGFSNGECSNWGNPQSEIYLETLRYFGGLSATSAFSVGGDESGYINGLTSASWTDPLSNANYCAPINVIHFNASTSSFDGDELGGFSALPGSPSATVWTDKVGAAPEVKGGPALITDAGEYFIGEVSGGSTDKACSPKDLDALSEAEGVCPEAPWLEGTYQIAGLAYYANQSSIRTDLTDVDGNTADVRIKTYGVALSPAQPVIEVPVPGSTDGQQVILLPACMEYRDGGSRHNGNCAIVDFRIVEPHSVSGSVGTGKFMVLWESAQHGGDYDQDMGGVISYSIDSSTNQIAVTTQVYGASTGGIHGFGYVISGTTQDGLHIHSGHNNFDEYTDPYGLLDCDDGPGGDCDSGDPATTQAYTLGSTTATALQTPMYYATKWGGFTEETDTTKRPPNTDAPNGIPDQAYEWDESGDGLPDNYFFARNPGQLSSQLQTVFEAIATVTSSASVVANSVSLQTTTRIYQARFNSGDWSGKLLSFPVDVTTGTLLPPEWDAGEVMAGQDYSTDRAWLTWDGSAGVAFRWDDNGTPADLTDDTSPLTTTQRTLLNLNPDSGSDDGLGMDRLNFLRGDTSNELANGGTFRNRSTPLGDVVHSTPTIVGRPNFGYRDTSYLAFKTKYAESECYDSNGNPINSWAAGTSGNPGSREPMVYFGGNDGAVHAVSACDGEERLAYVPNALYANLPELTSQDYTHRYYVDGPVTVVDAFFDVADGGDGAWHTVLVGTLGAGGNSVFALDVTEPGDFSESNASDLVLWEKTAADTDYAEMGYTYSQPAVIKAEGYGWVAAFGNGYDSASGHAILYFARITDGARQAMFDVGGTANGMSTVSPIDTDGDGDVDLIYGGDLNGNVWRFKSNSGVWTSTLLYAAKSASGVAQPITSRLAVGYHPTSAAGRMVFFGTGKYYETADQDPDNAVQYNTMYGIWDRDDGRTVSSVTTRNSTVLQQQEILTQATSTFGSNTFDVRVVSNSTLTWEIDTTKTCSTNVDKVCGWYLDLINVDQNGNPARGEKMVSNPVLRGGRLIFVTTIPSLEVCKAGGDGWLMEIDPRTGGRLDYPVFDLNGDGVFTIDDNYIAGANSPDFPVSGKKSKVGILQPPAILAGVGGAGDGGYGGAEAKYSSGTDDAQIDVTIENPGLLGAGRKSWVRIK